MVESPPENAAAGAPQLQIEYVDLGDDVEFGLDNDDIYAEIAKMEAEDREAEDAEAAADAQAAEVLETPPAKRRGRPPKQGPKRPRGRPRKAAQPEPEPEDEEPEEGPVGDEGDEDDPWWATPRSGPRVRSDALGEPRQQERPSVLEGDPKSWPLQWRREVPLQDDCFAIELSEHCYPATGIIPLYIRYCQQGTDAPLAHHWAAAVSGIAACAGPAHRVVLGKDALAPNVYALCIAQSGLGKSYALELLEGFMPPGLLEGVLPRSDRAYLEAVERKPWHTLVLDEAVGFFGSFAESRYQQILPDMILAYHAKKIEIEASTTGRVTARPEHIGFLAATTDQGLFASVPRVALQAAIKEGFLGRVFICPAATPEAQLKLRPLRHDEDWRREARLWFSDLYNEGVKLHAERQKLFYQLSPEAALELDRWLHLTGLRAPYPTLTTVWRRRPLFAYKLALIYHLSTDGTVEEPISAENMVCAISAVQHYLLPAFRLVADRAENIGVAEDAEKLRTQLLARPGGIAYTALGDLLRVGPRTVHQVLSLLAPHIHYERWAHVNVFEDGRISRRPGAPFLVVAWGDKPIEVRGPRGLTRPADERRLVRSESGVPWTVGPGEHGLDAVAVPPPPGVVALISEWAKGDGEAGTIDDWRLESEEAYAEG